MQLPNIFKYGEKLKLAGTLKQCPSKDCTEQDIKAYHYIYDPIENEGNFVPRAIYDELHNLKPRTYPNTTIVICRRYSLSMFNAFENARDYWYNALDEKVRNLLNYKSMTEGNINKSDGVISKIANNGHFSLYEYTGVDLSLKFKSILTL